MTDPTKAQSPVTALSHIAIATPEADVVAETLIAAFGAVRGGEELLDDGALRVVFIHAGPVTFELLEPQVGTHTVAKFLHERGPGLHHVSLAVGDLPAALARCRDAGVRLIDEQPRRGAHDSQIAFLHPRSMAGVLVELCQEPDR